jgi:hypothetical protein
VKNVNIMKLQSFEQTAAYHTRAADLAFINGNVDTAVSHLRAAFHAANNNRSEYLITVSKSLIERYDNNWNKQARLVL